MKISKKEWCLLIICLSLSIIILGVLMNYIVIVFNDCLMPVYKSPDADLSNKHFNFIDYERIKYPYFSDIIGWENNKFSFGDLLIYIGMIGSFSFVIRYIIIKLIEEKQ